MYKRLLICGLIATITGALGFVFALVQLLLARSDPAAPMDEIIQFLVSTGILFIIGLIPLIIGIKDLRSSYKTAEHGIQTYALITHIVENKNTMLLHRFGSMMYKAIVLVLDKNGTVYEVTKDIGANHQKYKAGNFVVATYFQNDINILYGINRTAIPPKAVNKLLVSQKMQPPLS